MENISSRSSIDFPRIDSALRRSKEYALSENEQARLRRDGAELRTRLASAIEKARQCVYRYENCAAAKDLKVSRLEPFNAPETGAEKALELVMQTLDTDRNGGKCFLAASWGEKLCFDFKETSTSPYYELIPSHWEPSKPKDSLFGDLQFFKQMLDFDQSKPFFTGKETPKLVVKNGEIRGAVFYFGYQKSSELGVARVELEIDRNGKTKLSLSESPRWNTRSERAIFGRGFQNRVSLHHYSKKSEWTGGIDAVLQWDYNTVYFFKGDQYIKWNIKEDRPYSGYPKSISVQWPGLWPDGIDAAVRIRDKAYFFKGDRYLRYSLRSGGNWVDPNYPASIEKLWPGLFFSEK